MSFNRDVEEKAIRELSERANRKNLLPQLNQLEQQFTSIVALLKQTELAEETVEQAKQIVKNFDNFLRFLKLDFQKMGRDMEDFLSARVHGNVDYSSSLLIQEGKEWEVVDFRNYYSLLQMKNFQQIYPPSGKEQVVSFDFSLTRGKSNDEFFLLSLTKFASRKFQTLHEFVFPFRFKPLFEFMGVDFMESNGIKNEIDETKYPTPQLGIHWGYCTPVLKITYENQEFVDEESLLTDNFCLHTFELFDWCATHDLNDSTLDFSCLTPP